MPGWVVFVVIAVIVLAVLGWLGFEDSFVRIEPGHLGLVLYKGRATDRVLQPGPHFVPTLRSKMVQVYPSLELSYRAARANRQMWPTASTRTAVGRSSPYSVTAAR